MTGPRIGALFAGYGGLEMGVQSVLGGELAWYSEIDKGALKILTHRHPDVPNVGDVTTADWSQVEPVDILTGGSPCQDLSNAGKRAGMTEGTRSNLWVAMREAIAQLRPGLVVWENVRGAYSAEADSGLEFCAGCMGDAWYRGAALRALGRVLGDLSDLGYDAGWHGLRAADVGAPHGRMRVFVVAYPSGDAGWVGYGDGAATALAHDRGPRHRCAGPNRWGEPLDSFRDGSLLPTPRATDGTKGGPNQRGSSGDLMLPSAVAALLPTPVTTDWNTAASRWDDPDHRTQLRDVAALLPTPTSQAAKHSGGDTDRGEGSPDDANLWIIAQRGQWGDYADAIARWEHATGRPAPAPTMTSSKGNPQLAPAFVEWMMGLPAGWVTDTPGITRNEALKALGNGVVPQQAEAALRYLLPALERAA